MSISEKNNTTSKVSGDTWERLFGIEQEEQKLIDDGIRIRQEQYEQTKKKSVNTKEYSSGYLEFDLHDDYSQHIGIVWENVGKMFCFSCNKEFKTETNNEEER